MSPLSDGWNPDVPHEAFFLELEEYKNEYELYLATTVKRSTILKHAAVINGMIDYVCVDHGAAGFEDITAAMVNSKFLSWYNSHTHEGLQKVTAKNILKGYFQFIYDRHGIKSDLIMKSLDRK